MLRFFIHALGLVALAGAFARAVMDGARSIANNALMLWPTGAALESLAPAKFAQITASVQKNHPKLWDPALIDLLWVPTSVTLAVLGVALMALASAGRQRRR